MKRIASLKEIQEINFDMMMYINRIARRHGIKVMLSGGTLLGAVRHRDFIPWDDDVDMMLFRKEYNRLIQYINDDKKSPYKIMTAWNTPTYQFPFAKLVDTRTCLDEKNTLKIHGMGVSADIFPIDPLPNHKKLREWFMQFIGRRAFRVYDLRSTDYKKIQKSDYRFRIAVIKLNIFVIQILSKLFRLEKSDYVAVTIGKYKEREIMRKADMADCVPVLFHGEEFFAPKGYKAYLSSLYGRNYMEMPPKTKQKPDHAVNAYWRSGFDR